METDHDLYDFRLNRRQWLIDMEIAKEEADRIMAEYAANVAWRNFTGQMKKAINAAPEVASQSEE